MFFFLFELNGDGVKAPWGGLMLFIHSKEDTLWFKAWPSFKSQLFTAVFSFQRIEFLVWMQFQKTRTQDFAYSKGKKREWTPLSTVYILCIKGLQLWNLLQCAHSLMSYLHLKGPMCESSAGKCCSSSGCCAGRRNYLLFEAEAWPETEETTCELNVLLLFLSRTC